MEEGILSGHRIALREQMQFETPKGRTRSEHLQVEHAYVVGGDGRR